MMDFYMSLLFLLGFFSVQMETGGEVNVATWGTADQSSTFSDWYAPHAADGSKSSCACTLRETDPWWKLDLKKAYSVNRVAITNRWDCCGERLNGAEIRIGNDPSDLSRNSVCAVVSSIPTTATQSYSCGGMEGRYVTMNIPGDSKILSFCELEVYAITDNLAAGKNVKQSTTFENWSAQKAIDLNPGFTQPSLWCSSTNNQTNPWWRVDLSSVYRINRVVITNRPDCCQKQLNGAEIRIGNSLDNNGNNNPVCAVISSSTAGVSSTYTCDDMEGRYVNLFNPGNQRSVTLCEVEVYEEDFCEDET